MSKRHRGFIENYQPRAATVDLIERVQAVLRLYAAFLPLTIRQIFYRLVGASDGSSAMRRPSVPTSVWPRPSARRAEAGLSTSTPFATTA